MRTKLVTTVKRQAAQALSDRYEPLQQRIAVLEGIAKGEKAITEGRILTTAQARSRMARWAK